MSISRDEIERILRAYRLQYTISEDGDHYPLVEALSPGPTIEEGEQEIELLADALAADLAAWIDPQNYEPKITALEHQLYEKEKEVEELRPKLHAAHAQNELLCQKGVNRFGVDCHYFSQKLALILRDLSSYNREELSREFARLSETATPETK